MKVHIDPTIEADPALLDPVQRATEILEREVRISRSWDRVTASWSLVGSVTQTALFRLQISDEVASTQRLFPSGELKHRQQTERSMIRLWGDLLERRSHNQVDALELDRTSDRHIDGSEALDRIIDSVEAYSEREGHKPSSLKLPIRYATALMKLGPTYWGDEYRRIRESGLRAFDGQTLMGMKVELIPGVDAELQVV